MVNDVIETTRENIKGIGSADDARAAPAPLAAFSPGMAEEERVLKRFMYANLYYHEEQEETATRARDVIARLFAAISRTTDLLPESWRTTLPPGEPGRSRHIADFIAGMTDRFAMDRYRAIFGQTPRGLSNV